jgi:DNA-binding NarL/FixJ family response regulator
LTADIKIRLVIADDHDIYRDGLNILLSKDKDIQVVGEASNGRRLIELVKLCKPDVVISDLIMPDMDGIEAIKAISELGLPVRCIALSTFDSDHLIVRALEVGALGYIIKNAQRGEIIEAVKKVYEYNPYYCKSTSSKLVRMISYSRFNPYTKSNLDLFSEKEKEIIRLICIEKTSRGFSFKDPGKNECADTGWCCYICNKKWHIFS